jgi:hypothetical protein
MGGVKTPKSIGSESGGDDEVIIVAYVGLLMFGLSALILGYNLLTGSRFRRKISHPKMTIETLICARPTGCGWAFTKTVAFGDVWYWGPIFEDGCTTACRSMTKSEFKASYADCQNHLQVRRE